MEGGVELGYEWERDLEPYTSKENIEKLCQRVNNAIRKGQIIKWSVIIGDFLIIALLFLLIGVLNVVKKEMDLRISLINGIIAFELAIVTFISPIQSTSITKKEVDRIVGKQVTGDIMEKIRKTVEQKASGIQKWLAFAGACGVFATLILKLTN